MQSNGKPEPELNDGFEQGGWQVPYFDHDMDRLTADWIAAADAFLLGSAATALTATGVAAGDDRELVPAGTLPMCWILTDRGEHGSDSHRPSHGDRVRWRGKPPLAVSAREERHGKYWVRDVSG